MKDQDIMDYCVNQAQEIIKLKDEVYEKNSDVVSLARSIMELSAICNELCSRVEVLEKSK